MEKREFTFPRNLKKGDSFLYADKWREVSSVLESEDGLSVLICASNIVVCFLKNDRVRITQGKPKT